MSTADHGANQPWSLSVNASHLEIADDAGNTPQGLPVGQANRGDMGHIALQRHFTSSHAIEQLRSPATDLNFIHRR